MKRGQVDLLRHGETEGGSRFNGSTDVLLSCNGWVQLTQAVEQANQHWHRIYSSPLARCALFAQALASEKKLPFCLDHRFQEMHFGSWEGLSAQELLEIDAEALTRFWRNPAQYTPPLAEPLVQFQERVLIAWHEMLARHPGENILLLTHGGVIRTLMCHIQQRPLEQLLEVEAVHAVLHSVAAGVPACCAAQDAIVDGAS